MADWNTIASLATASGTLVLAVATFSSVRSANRSARIAEQTMMLGLRPVLAPTRMHDPPERVNFIDGHTATVPGGTAAVDREGGALYMVIPLRNVGAGLAVLDSWRVRAGSAVAPNEHGSLDEFVRLSRDLYVAAGDTGFWQGAIRDEGDARRVEVDEAIASGGRLVVDLLYGDHEGGQRTISRFGLTLQEDGSWLCGVVRHWRLDGAQPR